MRPAGAWTKWGRHLVLFALTAASVFVTGAFGQDAQGHVQWEVRAGLQLVTALMAILLSHEMGHYVACRVYGIDATLPFFIPAPLLNPLAGTFGAIIRIKEPFPHRRALFDVGLAGPLAGFVVCLPVLVLAVFEAHVVSATPPQSDLLGEPLAFQLAFRFLRAAPPDGSMFQIGPLGMAAWFGLLVTGLNLLPVGQLDGGHAVYALWPRHGHLIARAVWWTSIVLIAVAGPSWILWSILVRFIGIRHPPTLDDEQPLGRARVVVALIALAVFAVSFLMQPVPFSWVDAWHALRAWMATRGWLTSS